MCIRDSVQTLGQLCANRVIEGDHRAAGLCSHFQNLDVLFNILYGNSFAILINSVSLLTCSIAAGSAHCTISKQRSCLLYTSYQVPGGMFSNMLKQLKDAGKEDKLDEVLAEIPRVREDAGYPPLVTPTSQIVGTQAVFNVILGERYKMVTKEFKGLVHGDYGKTPAPIKPEFTKKILGDEQPITCRFADTLAPEMDKLKAEAAKWATQEEDVLTYAMFCLLYTSIQVLECRLH